MHVTFAILQRNGRSHPFLQKNTMFSAHFPSKTDLAHQLPPESWEMPNIEELFRSYPSNELIHFHNNLKKWLFPIFVFLVTFFHIQAKFYRKPKWCVWSIWTYSTRRISKLVTQKVSFWRKLKIEGFEKIEKSVWGAFEAQNGFSRNVSETKMNSKYILDHSRPIPTQFSCIKNMIFNKNQWKLMKAVLKCYK